MADNTEVIEQRVKIKFDTADSLIAFKKLVETQKKIYEAQKPGTKDAQEQYKIWKMLNNILTNIKDNLKANSSELQTETSILKGMVAEQKKILAEKTKENKETSKAKQIISELIAKIEQRKKETEEMRKIDHQIAIEMDKQIEKQNILNARTERHKETRKLLAKTLHQNANTLERMQHNRQVLNNKLKKTVVGEKDHKKTLEQIEELENRIKTAKGKTLVTQKKTLASSKTESKTKLQQLTSDKTHRTLLQQQYKLQHKIEYETRKIQQNSIGFTATMKDAVRNAFSWQKIMNRIAFVITAKLSYDLMRIAQTSMKQMVSNAVDFEKEMSKVFTLLEKNEDAFKNILSKEVLSAMVKYGSDLEKTSRAVYDILSARFDPGDVQAILDESLILSIGEFTNLKVATNAVLTVLNSFQMEATQAGEAASFLAQMVTDGRTTLEELEPNLGKMTSVASSLGYDMKQLGAAFSAITLQGYKSNVAITSLSTLMMRLMKPIGEAKDVISDFGLDLDIASIQAGGFNKILEEMIGLTEEEILAFATNRRGAKALFALINSGATFQELYNNQLENTNAHLVKYQERIEAVEKAKKRLVGLVKALSIEFGTKLLPAIKVIITGLSNLVLGIYEFGKILKKNALLITTFTAILVAYSYQTQIAAISTSALIGALKGPVGLAVAIGVATTALLIGLGSLSDYNNGLNNTGLNASNAVTELDKFSVAITELDKEEQKFEKAKLERLIAFTESRTDISNRQKRLLIKNAKERLDAISKIEDKARIRDAKVAYESALDKFKLSEKELSDLQEKEKSLKNFITIMENSGSAESAIIKRNIELVELRKKIRQEEIKLAKEAEGIAEENYKQAIKSGIGITEAELAKLKAMNDVLDVLDNELAIKKQITKIDTFREKLLDNIVNAYKRWNALGMGEQFEQVASQLHNIALSGNNAWQVLNALYETKELNMSIEEFKKLAKVIEAVEAASEKAKVSTKEIGKGSLFKQAIGLSDASLTSEESRDDPIADNNKAMVDGTQYAVSQMQDIWGGYLEWKRAEIEKDYEDEMQKMNDRYSAYEDHINGTVLTEQHKANALKALEDKKKEEEKKLEEDKEKELKRVKKEEKKMRIAAAIMNTAVAVTNALGTFPPGPWNIAIASAIGLMGAAQVAMIAKTKFATGGLPEDKIQNHPTGLIRGKGTGTSDSITAQISNKEFITKEKATRGNEKFMYYQQDQLAKGMTPLETAISYYAGKVRDFVMPVQTPRLAYAQGGMPASVSNSYYNMDTSSMENLISKQIKVQKEMNIRLMAIEEANIENAENTYTLTKSGLRF